MRVPVRLRHLHTLAVVAAVVVTAPAVAVAAAAEAPTVDRAADGPTVAATTGRAVPLMTPVPEPDPRAAAVPDRDAVLASDTEPAIDAEPAPDPDPEPAPRPEPTPPPEPYPPREPQTSCEVVDHAGVEALRDVVLAAHPGTGDGGIVRACDAGGGSEHKEGRAWDWMLDADDPDDAAAADEVLGWLLAEDHAGEPHALARRLGVLYVIWDGRIWSASRAAEGWRPYTGASPHTDHVHLSFSTPGARGETSFFDAGVWQPAVGDPYPATLGAEAAAEATSDG